MAVVREKANEIVPYSLKMTRVYKDSEKKALGKITQGWVTCFPEDEYRIPEILTLDQNGSPRTASTEDSIRRHHFANKKVKGRLASDAEEIITKILNYQQERRKRNWFRKGRWDDPTMLVLEELKLWASTRLYVFKCQEAELDEIKKRIQYLDTLSRDDLIFPSGSTSQLTMRSCLRQVKALLEEIVVPRILAEIATSSAREHLDRLEISAKMALNHMTLFLFYVLRNTKHTPQATINDILDQANTSALATARSRYFDALTSKSGSITKMCANHSYDLLSDTKRDPRTLGMDKKKLIELKDDAPPPPPSPPPKHLQGNASKDLKKFEKDAKKKKSDKKSKTDGKYEAIQAAMAKGEVVNVSLEEYAALREKTGKGKMSSEEENKIVIQKVMMAPKTGPARDEADAYMMEFMEKGSGIVKFFKTKPEILYEFIRLHGWMGELAKITQLVAQARALAGVGGDLLVYGLANEQVNNMMKTFQKLLGCVRESVGILRRATSEYFDGLVGNKQHRTDEKVWQDQHHQRATEMAKDLEIDMNDCVSCVGVVIHRANITSFRERYLQAASQTEQFVKGCSVFCSQFKGLLEGENWAQLDVKNAAMEAADTRAKQAAIKSEEQRQEVLRQLEDKGGAAAGSGGHAEAEKKEDLRLSMKAPCIDRDVKLLEASPFAKQESIAKKLGANSADPDIKGDFAEWNHSRDHVLQLLSKIKGDVEKLDETKRVVNAVISRFKIMDDQIIMVVHDSERSLTKQVTVIEKIKAAFLSGQYDAVKYDLQLLIKAEKEQLQRVEKAVQVINGVDTELKAAQEDIQSQKTSEESKMKMGGAGGIVSVLAVGGGIAVILLTGGFAAVPLGAAGAVGAALGATGTAGGVASGSFVVAHSKVQKRLQRLQDDLATCQRYVVVRKKQMEGVISRYEELMNEVNEIKEMADPKAGDSVWSFTKLHRDQVISGAFDSAADRVRELLKIHHDFFKHTPEGTDVHKSLPAVDKKHKIDHKNLPEQDDDSD